MSETTSATLDAAELGAFTALLDTLIPPIPERGLPGAGEADLARTIDASVPDLRTALRPGLARLDEMARARGAEAFADLPRAERTDALSALVDDDPGFLPGIVYHTYAHYYRSPAVLEALGLEARPPFPLGYRMEPFDPDTLSTVRGRAPFYRGDGS